MASIGQWFSKTHGGCKNQHFSGSWCGDWERSARSYTNNNQHSQAGAESLPTIQKHISEASTSASAERKQQASIQPEQPEHPQFSQSRGGKKANFGVNCKPCSSTRQRSDNSTAIAWHVLSIPSMLWPTLSGSFSFVQIIYHNDLSWSLLLSRYTLTNVFP